MKNQKKLFLLFGLILTVFVLAACSSASSEESAFPTGRFISQQSKHVGYQFNEDKTWVYLYYGEHGAEGTYKVDGNLWIEQGTEECPFPGTYEWSFDGSQLSFKLVGKDACEPRRESTDRQVFTLVVPEDTAASVSAPAEVAAQVVPEGSAAPVSLPVQIVVPGVPAGIVVPAPLPTVLPVASATIPEIRIDAADYAYTVPESIPSGWVRVILTNSGAEPHHVQFLRLNEGVTFEQFQEALALGEGPALAVVQQMGGVGAIAPTGSAQAVLNLTAGEYVILCFVPSPSDHVPHLAKGMLQYVKVEAAPSSALADEPSAEITVKLADFLFDMPETLPAGETVIKVVNNGPEAHEMNLLRLAEGKTLSDVMAYLSDPQGPPPFLPVGGINGLNPGLSGYLEYDFTPGKYIAICNIPSPANTGMPHSQLGMIKEITVR